MSNRQITKISDYLAEIDDFKNGLSNLSNYTLFFRGQSIGKIEPKIFSDNLTEAEHLSIKEMTARLPNEMNLRKNTFDKLTFLQHYGVPTRLLDVTTDPLVALYFACGQERDKPIDKEIIIFAVKNDFIQYSNDDIVHLVSRIAEYSIDELNHMKKLLSLLDSVDKS